jgi:hypothetical protein
MPGSIRIILGLVIAFGAVGGVEHSVNNLQLLASTLVALVGIGLMIMGLKAHNDYYN